MLNSFWRLLKSGTDIRGVACENEAGEAVNLTDDAVAAIANGFLVWLEGRACLLYTSDELKRFL